MNFLPIDNEVFSWVVLPILIFVSRIFDVSFSTLRIIFLSRGQKALAPVLGFFEVLIWLLAMSQIMQNLDNIFCYLAYGLGFSAGTLVGMLIEEKLAIGIQVIRIIVTKDATNLKGHLVESGFGVTVLNAMGASGEVIIIYTIVRRKDVKKVTEIIKNCNPKAFYSIEDAITAKDGVFPPSRRSQKSFKP